MNIFKQVAMNKETQKFFDDHLGTADVELIPIKKGGSDRSFFRLCLPDKTSYIFMHYGTEVEENAHWSAINKFLAGLEISVPQIIAQDLKQHFLLLDDLGDVDLWAQRELPWDKRRDCYLQVLTQIRRLHAYPLDRMPANLKLSESYSPRLYQWEHDYFLENLEFSPAKFLILGVSRYFTNVHAARGNPERMASTCTRTCFALACMHTGHTYG